MAIFNLEYLQEAGASKGYFRLSLKNMDGEIVSPSIPDNYFTKNGYEDSHTKRVCFGPDINRCLMAMSRNVTGQEFYVMVPDGEYEIYKPTAKEVPDSTVTKEVRIKEPVKVKCIGKVKCTGDAGKPGRVFTYGNGQKAELYDWKYKWIEKY